MEKINCKQEFSFSYKKTNHVYVMTNVLLIYFRTFPTSKRRRLQLWSRPRSRYILFPRRPPRESLEISPLYFLSPMAISTLSYPPHTHHSHRLPIPSGPHTPSHQITALHLVLRIQHFFKFSDSSKKGILKKTQRSSHELTWKHTNHNISLYILTQTIPHSSLHDQKWRSWGDHPNQASPILPGARSTQSTNNRPAFAACAWEKSLNGLLKSCQLILARHFYYVEPCLSPLLRRRRLYLRIIRVLRVLLCRLRHGDMSKRAPFLGFWVVTIMCSLKVGRWLIIFQGEWEGKRAARRRRKVGFGRSCFVPEVSGGKRVWCILGLWERSGCLGCFEGQVVNIFILYYFLGLFLI